MNEYIDLRLDPREWFVLTIQEWGVRVVKTLTRFQVEKLLLQSKASLWKIPVEEWEHWLSIEQCVEMLDFLERINDNAFRIILREFDSGQLVKILRVLAHVGKHHINDKIFWNMSQRAWSMLKDDMESKNPLSMEYLEVAISSLLNIAHRLELEWQIIIPKPGEKYID